MHALETFSTIDHALILTKEMDSAIEQTAHVTVNPPEVIDPLMLSIVRESGPEQKLHTYRTLGDMSIDAIFVTDENDIRIGARTGRKREDVISDLVTDRRLFTASRAGHNFVRIKNHVHIANAGRATS